ncbi:chitin biosynthesis protein [Trichoderma austrokoningii]
MLVSLTVGKVDAGVTVLLTPDKRLIEFPSILLPPNISSGSIVDITVGRNTAKEAVAEDKFRSLQDRIFQSFGASEPAAPILRCRNATQTSVVLEWDPIELATADLMSLSLYRNGQKAGNIPRPLEMHSTKISGLAVDTEYTFHLVLRTSAGTRASEKVVVRTHKMTDLSGITITTGIMPASTRENLIRAVERIGAKIVDGVRIDTTHFVTTEGRGTAWEKAVENNIPVVRPEWVTACEQNGRIFGVTKFYLDVMRPGPPSDEQLPPPPPKELPPKDLPRRTSPPEPEAAGKKSPEATSPPPGPAPPVTPPAGKKSPESGAEAGSKASAEAEDDSDARDEREEGEAAEPKAKSTEQKARTNDQAEQKVRLEDVQGQLRPGGSQTAIVEEVAEGEEAGDEDEGENRAATPPDGASFQEVEL